MDGRVLRRSVTLADQLAAAVGPAAASAAGSCNLRDLLKLRDEDDGRRAAAAVTLASAMQADRRASSSPPPSAVAAAAAARTLLDIIRDDQPAPAPGSYGAGAGDPFVRRAVSLPAPQPASPPAAAPPMPPTEASPPADREEGEEQGERVSLMALLEQTDRQWSAVAAAPSEQDPAASDPSEQDAFVPEDDADLPARGAGAAGGGCCCVCMARAKGAAFIPCGHTFCRGCARELLAGRGRCPLCNAAIVDVLDIF
ncbi:hypothetical protein QYE76_030216 [Lolium multiflorum]|uniref:RING-type domain-containing protein n=1 Tax=Lolium multiflorum TaxID=4521 RepID=A0AAD8VJ09_LOLMU|nr:hypothetical protein QYE76_030216 [Lolium multiflorum]